MTEQEVNTLISDLSKPKLFAVLSENGRKWFAKRVISRLREGISPTSDTRAQVETDALKILAQAKTITEANLDTSTGSTKEKWDRPGRNSTRSQISYGLLGVYPHLFIDSDAYDSLFRFTLERRFRAVWRMRQFVAPYSHGCFLYPDGGFIACKVNEAAKQFWTGVTSYHNELRFPFKLSESDGKTKPADAIEKLFVRYKVSIKTKSNNAVDEIKNKRNRFPCDPVVTIVHIASLQAAFDNQHLYSELVKEGDDYLMIDHPFGSMRADGDEWVGGTLSWTKSQATSNGHVEVYRPGAFLLRSTSRPQDGLLEINREVRIVDSAGGEDVVVVGVEFSNGDYRGDIKLGTLSRDYEPGSRIIEKGLPDQNIVTDKRSSKALFEQRVINCDDIVVGDHIYILNHPLHQGVIPSSIWSGEHSIVIDRWRGNDIQSTHIAGHGARNASIMGLANLMLAEINQMLTVARIILREHINWLKNNTPEVGDSVPDDLLKLLNKHYPGIGFSGEYYMTAYNKFYYTLPKIKQKKNVKRKRYPDVPVFMLKGNLGSEAIDWDYFVIFPYNPNVTDLEGKWGDIIFIHRLNDVEIIPASKPHLQYGITYYDEHNHITRTVPLYWQENDGSAKKKWKPRWIRPSEVRDLSMWGGSADEAFITRPRVDETNEYKNMLKEIKAVGEE